MAAAANEPEAVKRRGGDSGGKNAVGGTTASFGAEGAAKLIVYPLRLDRERIGRGVSLQRRKGADELCAYLDIRNPFIPCGSNTPTLASAWLGVRAWLDRALWGRARILLASRKAPTV